MTRVGEAANNTFRSALRGPIGLREGLGHSNYLRALSQVRVAVGAVVDGLPTTFSGLPQATDSAGS